MSGQPEGEGEEANLERWLITYADMITLLMAFFIMLYAMSVVDLKKFEALKGAIGGVFGGAPVAAADAGVLDGGKGLLGGGGSLIANSATLANSISRQIDTGLREALKGHVKVTHDAGLVTVTMKADRILFPVGEAKLTAAMREVLDVLGPPLAGSGATLLVEGHTCDLPISTSRFPSNWELSAQRASNVMVHLIRHSGISPHHISAVGFADTRPLVANDSESHRARNRRVDIVVLASSATHLTSASAPADGDDDAHPQPIRLVPRVDITAGRLRPAQGSGPEAESAMLRAREGHSAD
ncbi:MAG: flagellar motor protein MotB [Armatimonadota bacterium]|nr:flagellar motor protein MotB [Armatimonadota bacterium]